MPRVRARELNLTLDPALQGPIYVRVAEAILMAVRAGQIQPGQALPGVRELADRLGVHRNTTLAALRELETRWDYADPAYADGIPETFTIDQSKHSLFGASKAAAGLKGIFKSFEHAFLRAGPLRTAALFARVNQKDGFDCQSCAWPSPDGKRHMFEFCENGAKAMASESAWRTLDRKFFGRHSVPDLLGRSDHWHELQGRLVELVAKLENLPIRLQNKARVVVNEKTGTVVMGAEVRIGAVSIVQGGLAIQVTSTVQASQPNAFSKGKTVTTEQKDIKVEEEKMKTLNIEPGISVGRLAEMLNNIGITPRDMIAILQAIKDAGALQAELRVL